MNAKELSMGSEIAVVASLAAFDKQTVRATKCEVVSKPTAGVVSVMLLEDARNRLGVSGYGRFQKENWKKAGATVRVKTSQCWMPWSNLETRASNERKQADEKAAVERAREERLAGLQQRLDQFAGEVDETIAWAGERHREGSPDQKQIEKYVQVPTPALEALLNRAESLPTEEVWGITTR